MNINTKTKKELLEEIKKLRSQLRSQGELEAKVSQRTSELAKTNELLEIVFLSVDLCIAYMDRDFNFLRVNRAYAEADGRKPEFYLGKNHFSLFPNEENERIFRRVVESGEPYSIYAKPFEYDGHPERGITYWDWSLQPVIHSDGNVVGAVLSLVDVSKRIQAEESVRRNEALLKTVFETLPVGVWLADKDGRIYLGNPAGQKIWEGAKYVGIDQFKEYKGWWVETGKQIEPDEWAVARAVRKGETSIREEIEIECFDGSHKTILNSAVPIKDKKQEIIGAFIVNEDITERKKVEQNLRQIQKMEALGTLAGGIAHDFNNILMPIIVSAEMLLWDSDTDDLQNASLNQILESAKRGKELVKQIISYSRKSSVEKNTIDLVSLINESLSFLKAFLPPTIKIELDINIDKGRIKGNATQINQILMNLCANAADAIGINEGCIRIILDHKDFEKEGMSLESGLKPSSYVRISVSDSGPGIKQDIINKIFDPFFSTKDPSKGSGMGLSVVRRIVYDHGGTITVDNKPGKGATFHVYFPQSDGLTEAEPRLSDFLPGGNERILLVDDEALMVQSIQALLQRIGYEVTGVTSGRDALNIFRARPDAADLVITDQTMPDLTGIEMAKELSRIRPDIPLILMTGFSETLSSEVSEDRGIDAFLMKPVNSSEMATTVRRVLDRKK